MVAKKPGSMNVLRSHRHGVRHVVAFRSLARAVDADEPELVGGAGGEGAELDDRDGRGVGDAGGFRRAAQGWGIAAFIVVTSFS